VTTLTHESALNPATVAVVGALRADVPVQTWLHERPVAPVGTAKRVYAVGAAPSQLAGRRIDVGNPSEGWDVRFMRGGSRLTMLLHLWHTPVEFDDVSQTVTAKLWAFVAVALSPRLVLVAPHVMLAGVPTLVDIARDPDGRTWHGVVRYEARTKVVRP
jgi:hypothetical protein